MVHRGLGELEKQTGVGVPKRHLLCAGACADFAGRSPQKARNQVSLRTKNLNEARARLPAALIEFNQQFAAVTKVADAVAAPADEVGRGVLEQIARTWFEPRWRATGESLWKPIPVGATVEDALCNIDPELARLTPPDEVTFGEYLYQARGLLAAAGYSKPSGSSAEVLAQFMVRGEIECLNRSCHSV